MLIRKEIDPEFRNPLLSPRIRRLWLQCDPKGTEP